MDVHFTPFVTAVVFAQPVGVGLISGNSRACGCCSVDDGAGGERAIQYDTSGRRAVFLEAASLRFINGHAVITVTWPRRTCHSGTGTQKLFVSVSLLLFFPLEPAPSIAVLPICD